MVDKKGQLEVEVIRARGLIQKPGSKSTPGMENNCTQQCFKTGAACASVPVSVNDLHNVYCNNTVSFFIRTFGEVLVIYRNNYRGDLESIPQPLLIVKSGTVLLDNI